MMEPTFDMKRLKDLELQMLEVFIETCEKLNLQYYILGGTLLGAVRHKGFIPWDDDIDVGMPRKDYEKWIREAQGLITNKSIFIQSIYSEPEYPADYAKMRNSQTTFIESTWHNLKVNHGVYIDIFPLDFYPEKKVHQTIYHIKDQIYAPKTAKLYDFSAVNHSEKVSKKIIVKLLDLFFRMDAYDALKKRNKLHITHPKTQMVANLAGAWGKKEIVPFDSFAYT